MEAPDKSATREVIFTDPSIPSPFASPPPSLVLPSLLLHVHPLLGTDTHPTQSLNAIHPLVEMQNAPTAVHLTNANTRAAQHFLLFNSWKNVDTLSV